MANIDKELKAIEEAIYGEDVRSAIHDGIKAVNDSATDSAHVAETKADIAQSYAVGGTGTREGEDTDNAKYYYEMARGFSPEGYDDLVSDVAEMKVNKQDKIKIGNSDVKSFDENQFKSVNGKVKSKLQAKDILTDTNNSIQKELDELKSFESITYKGTVATFSDLPSDAQNGWMYYCQEDRKHYVCVNDPEIDLYEWHEYHTFDDNYLITVEKVKNDLETQEAGYVLDARQGYELKENLNQLTPNYSSLTRIYTSPNWGNNSYTYNATEDVWIHYAIGVQGQAGGFIKINDINVDGLNRISSDTSTTLWTYGTVFVKKGNTLSYTTTRGSSYAEISILN